MTHPAGIGSGASGTAAVALAGVLGLVGCAPGGDFTLAPDTMPSAGSALREVRLEGLSPQVYLQLNGGALALAAELSVTVGDTEADVVGADGGGLVVRPGRHLVPGAYPVVLRVGGRALRADRPLSVTDGEPVDGGVEDGGPSDGGVEDGGLEDAGPSDGGLGDADPGDPSPWSGCDPACATCSQSCGGGAPCDCDEGCCDMTCTAPTVCNGACSGADTVCGHHADHGVQVGHTCRDGAECFVDARNSPQARIRCHTDARCHVRCEDAEDCEVACETGAACTVACGGAEACGIERCMGGPVVGCGGGVFVCGAACP
jgi:hypothetical protein